MPTTPNPMPRNNGRSTYSAILEAALEVGALEAAHDDATDPRVNPCPECEEGEVVSTAPLGVPFAESVCSAGCGWSA